MQHEISKKNVAFKTSDGLTLRGWLFEPLACSQQRWPAIAMSHGMTALKEHFLQEFAEVFCAVGMVVLIWDNRHFGDSDGLPRQHIDVVLQRRDYRDAITFLSLQANIDKNRIGIWGSSLSGANVLAVAAQDRRVKAVVSQVPGSQYWPERNQLLLPTEKNKFDQLRINDRIQRMRGKAFATSKVVDVEKGEAAFGRDARAYQFFTMSAQWINAMTLASFDSIQEYDVADLVDKISPIPLLIIAATDDQLVPPATAFRVYEKALHPKNIVVIKGDHFCVYYKKEYFDRAVHAAKDWFIRYL